MGVPDLDGSIVRHLSRLTASCATAIDTTHLESRRRRKMRAISARRGRILGLSNRRKAGR